MSYNDIIATQLEYFFQESGIKSYNWKGILSLGRFPKVLLEDVSNKKKVSAKFSTCPDEGELVIWPKLKHRNIDVMISTFVIDDVYLFVSSVTGLSIRDAIIAFNFTQNQLLRKKSYAHDILSALTYLHNKSIALLNMTDENVKIVASSDTAIICEFSKATCKSKIVRGSLYGTTLYYPNEFEVTKDDDYLEAMPLDMWSCGLLFLNIFTKYELALGFGNPYASLKNIDTEIIVRANGKIPSPVKTVSELKVFLGQLLRPNPNLRISSTEAIQMRFIKSNQIQETRECFTQIAANSKCATPTSLTADVQAEVDGGNFLDREGSLNPREYRRKDVGDQELSRQNIQAYPSMFSKTPFQIVNRGEERPNRNIVWKTGVEDEDAYLNELNRSKSLLIFDSKKSQSDEQELESNRKKGFSKFFKIFQKNKTKDSQY